MIFNTADKIDYIYIKLCYLLQKPSSFHDFNYHFAQNMALISSPLLFFLSTVFVLISQANGQSSVSHFCLYDQGNYSTRSPYEANLDQILLDLVSSTNETNKIGRAHV